jgi:hypothetical protein
MSAKHPLPCKLDATVIERLASRGFRRLRCGEVRRDSDVYADLLRTTAETVGRTVASGDFIFRKRRENAAPVTSPSELTEKQRARIQVRAARVGFTDFEWEGSRLWAEHPDQDKTKRPDLAKPIRALGFFVPCSGIAGRFYAQVSKIAK